MTSVTQQDREAAKLPVLKLYYVRADDTNGENADAWVWAANPTQARHLCQNYWHRLSGGDPDDTIVAWVDEAPTEPPAKPDVVEWGNIVRHE